MAYPYPTNVTRMYELLQWSNEVSGYMLGHLIVLAIFIISFASSIRGGFPTKNCLAMSGFITTIFAILLRVLGVTSDFVIILCVIITAGAMISLFAEG